MIDRPAQDNSEARLSCAVGCLLFLLFVATAAIGLVGVLYL